MKKTHLIAALAVIAVALIIMAQSQNSSPDSLAGNTFSLNAQETECYRLGLANIEPRLATASDNPWNKDLILSDLRCQYYTSAPEYPYQVEAHGTVSDQVPDYTSSAYQEIERKDISFYGLYDLEYSEECLTIDGQAIYSEVWQGGEDEPRVTEGAASCRWLSEEEVQEKV